jgi:hypothetical protein
VAPGLPDEMTLGAGVSFSGAGTASQPKLPMQQAGGKGHVDD